MQLTTQGCDAMSNSRSWMQWMTPGGGVILWEDHKRSDNLKERSMPQSQ